MKAEDTLESTAIFALGFWCILPIERYSDAAGFKEETIGDIPRYEQNSYSMRYFYNEDHFWHLVEDLIISGK